MLERIHRLLTGQLPAAQAAARSFQERQLAAAALMVEAATMDSTFDAGERARIAALVQAHFGLSPDDAEDLVAAAERAASASVEWHGFTRAIKEGFDHAERVQLVEMLWEVAYADGKLDPDEDVLLRRVAGLIYISDEDRIAARQRVLSRLANPQH
jgi:uncharacterized tellurite resistance protein B-like protein